MAAIPRRIYHPQQKDYATFLKTSAETGGEYTLIEIELAPGGGNPPHYHRRFSERFEVINGRLNVQIGNAITTLEPGGRAVAPAGTLHRFFSTSDTPTKFRVEVRPGHTGFERMLMILYGLAADGKTNKRGLPTNLYELAVLGDMSDTNMPGLLTVLAPLFRRLAARARRKGIEQALIDRYCR
jgi:mannose-6-phosphate isomerase-like protein (cupin superfamily)